MINPFNFTKSKELVNIDYGLRAKEQISSDLNQKTMKHELWAYPPLIAEFDPEHNEMYLRAGNKATLFSLMKKQATSID